MYESLQKISRNLPLVQRQAQRRYQWTGPNYSKGVFIISLSAVVGAVLTSSFMKYWQFRSEYEPPTDSRESQTR